mgnify:CR=1 FL=1
MTLYEFRKEAAMYLNPRHYHVGKEVSSLLKGAGDALWDFVGNLPFFATTPSMDIDHEISVSDQNPQPKND